ncbi:MAG: hypothetical protein CMF55_04735 [Legionellales bacterium]|nr:hypothetical protein [Legionellales bacterium]
MHRLGQLLLARPLYAAAMVLLLVLSPILSVFCVFLAAAIIVLMTLQQGAKVGAFILLWVAVPAVVSFWFNGFGGYDALFVFCLLQWGLAILMRECSSWTLVLEVLLLVALLVLAGVHLAIPDIAAWWKSHLSQMYETSSVLSSLPDDEKQRLATLFSQYATGLLTFYMMAFLFLGLMAGRYWQAVLSGGADVFRASILAIRMNRWVVWVALAYTAGFIFKIPLCMDSISVILMPFVVASLSLLHALAKQRTAFKVLIGLLYVGLLFMQYIVAPVLASIALLDASLDFRQRLADSSRQKN